MSRNRPTGPGTRVYLRATTNPGGVGHGWVKARFITPAPPGTPIVEEYPSPDAGRHARKRLKRARVFIPSSVFDNPALLENDPDYLASSGQPCRKRKSRPCSTAAGTAFTGRCSPSGGTTPAHYDDQRWTHVIAPFRHPEALENLPGLRLRLFQAVLGGVVRGGRGGAALPRSRSCTAAPARPNEGLRIDPVEQARRIREAEQNDPVLRGRVIQGIADPAIFDESRGESIAAMMERSPNFLHWMPGDHTRLAGKMQFHYRLAFDGEGKPMFQVFNTCKHFIRTIPNLVYDESNVEDIDTRQEDHIYDECRYVLMEKPISPPRQHRAAPAAG